MNHDLVRLDRLLRKQGIQYIWKIIDYINLFNQ